MLIPLIALTLTAAPAWTSDPQVVADLKALTAPDAYHDGSWSRPYSDALYRLPAYVVRYPADESFFKKLAEVIAVCVHDSHLAVVILNAMNDDGQKLALLRELSRDFKPKMSLLAMAEALERVHDKDRKDLPDVLLPALERLLPLDDAQFKRDGWASPFSEVFRSRSVQLLSEHFPSDDRFVDYLWRLVAKDPSYAKCRSHEQVLRAYAGRRGDELRSRARGDPNRLIASLALSIVVVPRPDGAPVVQPERAALYPLAAKTAVKLGQKSDSLYFVYPVTALEQLGKKHPAGVVGLLDLYEASHEYHILTALLHIVVENRSALRAEDWKRLMQIMSRIPESVGGVSDIVGRADLGSALPEIRSALASTKNRQLAEHVARGLSMQPDEIQHAALSGIEQYPVEAKLGVLDGFTWIHPGRLLTLALTPLLSDQNPEVASKASSVLNPDLRPLRPRSD